MERIILLNDRQFPDAFLLAGVVPPAGVMKIPYVEQKIIQAVNTYNPKLQVQKIEYAAIEAQFPYYKKGKANGVLIEEFEIHPARSSVYRRNGCYVYTRGTKCMCRQILLYLFVSDAGEDTRNAFVSQTVFPTLLDYAADHLQSPSYSIANHKFCFINILNKKLTSKMILRHLAGLCAAGMEYVEVFGKDSVVPGDIPRGMKEFLARYASDYAAKYHAKTDVYEGEHYSVDFAKKTFVWKTASLLGDIIPKRSAKKSSAVDFNGSAEKFYWIEILPMAILAYKQGYKVDYSEYGKFVAAYRTRFSPKSEKFARCEVLLKYMEKFIV